jgi:hypothetical protein
MRAFAAKYAAALGKEESARLVQTMAGIADKLDG